MLPFQGNGHTVSRESGVLEQAPLTCCLIILSRSGRLIMASVRGQWWRLWRKAGVCFASPCWTVPGAYSGSLVCEGCPLSPTIPRWFCSTSHSLTMTKGTMIPVTVDSQHPLLGKDALILPGPLLWKIYSCSQDFRVLGPQVHSSCLKQKFTLPLFHCQ